MCPDAPSWAPGGSTHSRGADPQSWAGANNWVNQTFGLLAFVINAALHLACTDCWVWGTSLSNMSGPSGVVGPCRYNHYVTKQIRTFCRHCMVLWGSSRKTQRLPKATGWGCCWEPTRLLRPRQTPMCCGCCSTHCRPTPPRSPIATHLLPWTSASQHPERASLSCQTTCFSSVMLPYLLSCCHIFCHAAIAHKASLHNHIARELLQSSTQAPSVGCCACLYRLA